MKDYGEGIGCAGFMVVIGTWGLYGFWKAMICGGLLLSVLIFGVAACEAIGKRRVQ